MYPSVALSNSTSLSEEAASVSSGTNRLVHQDFGGVALNNNPLLLSTISPQYQQQQQPPQPLKIKKKRSLPGNPDPDAEVIALSPKSLLATNRFVCEICNKGFQRDQNLQLHRRGHNLPWKLKQRNSKDIRKRAYVCPEPSCVHHHPSRALGDLTGIKKHFCRKHGEKKWKCEKCSKIYAVQSDWKAHTKTCGTREYRCDCGTLFSRKDSFITHRAFCDALAEESARLSANQLVSSTNPTPPPPPPPHHHHHEPQQPILHNLHSQTYPPPLLFPFPWDPPQNPNPSTTPPHMIKPETHHFQTPVPLSSSQLFSGSSGATAVHHYLSATALLQKAATVGATSTSIGQQQSVGHMMTRLGRASQVVDSVNYMGFNSAWQKSSDGLTRDFLGLTRDGSNSGGTDHVNVSANVREMLNYAGMQSYERDHSLLKSHGFGFADQPPVSETWGDC
ncbi:protein indeterminate-domain 12 [Tripterygium wilfordii]|uniref:Protein indeterminate-domain 12 n=1 Tax=Tripterygium wilfordii TaxID=458696 RepID=A0A7J7CYB1_TRIWF|nr:protein indeterminate-domain 12-like [Tripterygium wilfordii]KAF5738866.1 protein indeterminate-domain 12 [Tripterygium wilfordii]